MTQRIGDLVEQFCQYQGKQRGRAERGVRTYRWILEHFLAFVQEREHRLPRVPDLNVPMIQAWMDDMGGLLSREMGKTI